MNRSLGFTLIELAIVLVVLGLLLGGLLMPLATQVDVARIRETNDALDKVQEALLGFAIANNNRLPCSDNRGVAPEDVLPDGLEDIPCPSPVPEGDLPWRTLGVGRYDGWGRTFRYRPDDAYVQSIGFPPDTRSGLVVQGRSSTPVALTADDPNGPAAIIYSTGKNWKGDYENRSKDDGRYTHGAYVEGEYDDVLVWLSKNILVSRLTAAGMWPP